MDSVPSMEATQMMNGYTVENVGVGFQMMTFILCGNPGENSGAHRVVKRCLII